MANLSAAYIKSRLLNNQSISVGGGGGVGPVGPAGVGAVSSVVAAEDIPQFAVVTSQGRVGNSATLGQVGKLFGLAQTAIATGFSGSVQTLGDITNPAWSWTAGDVVFLNGTSLSTSPPETGFVQIIGTAKAATTLVIELGPPIAL